MATDYAHNFHMKIRVIICELILMYFFRRDWMLAGLATSSQTEALPHDCQIGPCESWPERHLESRCYHESLEKEKMKTMRCRLPGFPAYLKPDCCDKLIHVDDSTTMTGCVKVTVEMCSHRSDQEACANENGSAGLPEGARVTNDESGYYTKAPTKEDEVIRPEPYRLTEYVDAYLKDSEGKEDDIMALMMRGPPGRKGGNPGRDRPSGRSRSRTERKQKQPRGTNTRRREMTLRRRTVRQRLAEKNVLHSRDALPPAARDAVNRDMRQVFTTMREHPRELGFPNEGLRLMEYAFRNDGAFGFLLSMGSFLNCLTHMIADVSALLDIIAIDLVEPHQCAPFEPVPNIDDLVAPENDDNEEEDEVEVENEEGEENTQPTADEGRGATGAERTRQTASASSGIPPRRRRATRARPPCEQETRRLPRGIPPWRRHHRRAEWRRKAQEGSGQGKQAASSSGSPPWKRTKVTTRTEEKARNTTAEETTVEGNAVDQPEQEEAEEEWEVEEEDDENEDADQEEEEESALMQEFQISGTWVRDGKQKGLLTDNQIEDYIARIKTKMELPKEAAPDGILKSLRRGARSKLPGIRMFVQRLREELHAAQTTWTPGMVPKWWKKIWMSTRAAVRRASRKRSRSVQTMALELMQKDAYLDRLPEEVAYKTEDRYWLARMLRRDLQIQTSMLGSTTARIRQLEAWVLTQIGLHNEGCGDVLQMTLTVLAAAGDVQESLCTTEENEPDAVDAWVEGWRRRVEAWLRLLSYTDETAVVIDDTLDERKRAVEKLEVETEFVKMVTTETQHYLWELMKKESKRKRKKEVMAARQAQQWDDWAVHQAMNEKAETRTRDQGTQTCEDGQAEDRQAERLPDARDAKKRKEDASQSGEGLSREHEGVGSAPSEARGSMDGPNRAPCEVQPAGQGTEGEIDQERDSDIGLNVGLDMDVHADIPEPQSHINGNNRGNDGTTETSVMFVTETIPDVEEEL